MSSYNLLMLPGDGIGPEVIKEVERVIAWFNKNTQIKFETESELVGGAAFDSHGAAISENAMDLAHKCDAIIFGAVGAVISGVIADKVGRRKILIANAFV